MTQLSHGLRRPLCKGGEGFGGFLGLCEKTFLLITIPQEAVFPLAGRVFFYNVAEQDYFTITSTIVSTKHITQGKENIRLISAAA
jgi:hypothetical protein